MMIPVRCWTCGKPIGHLWEDFKERTAKGEDKKKVLDDLKLKRYCCRQALLGHVDVIDTTSQFKRS